MNRESVLPSDDDDILIDALKNNPFDIVGLAELPDDDETQRRCLRSLYDIVVRRWKASAHDTSLLARVLLGLVTVARQYYAKDGKSEYWPFLSGRLADAVVADRRKNIRDELLDGQSQARLGDWFRVGLDKFQYGIPTEGKRHIGPIVFHAGVPKASLPSVLEVITSACVSYGQQATALPFEIRRRLVIGEPSMHVYAREFFASRLRGAEQLWACLARVAHAWIARGDYHLELRRLPPGLDADSVRDELRKAQRPDRPAGLPPLRVYDLPIVSFDVETGEVRLSPPHGAPDDWYVHSSEHVELRWTQAQSGWTAEFRRPLPPSVTIKPSAMASGSTFVLKTQAEKWAGYWFRADNGQLLDGDEIDANGLPPGRWIVVLPGTPTSCSVTSLRQVRLQWGWLKNSSQWTAWEIDVPPRTAATTRIVWHFGGNESSVFLQRRPDARIDISGDRLCTAKTNDGREIEIYRTPPRIISHLSRPLEVLLTADNGEQNSVPLPLTLRPGQNQQLSLLNPGVYQIAEPANDRPLLRFAWIPQAEVDGPVVDHDSGTGCICLNAEQSYGQLLTTDGFAIPISRGWYSHEFSLTEPSVELTWKWATTNTPTLRLRWPIEGVRWKVLGLSSDLAEWTRQTIIMSPNNINSSDIQIEIQYPIGADLLINGRAPMQQPQNTPSGAVYRLPLDAWQGNVSEGIRGLLLNVDGDEYPAVNFSNRPVLNSLAVLIDDSTIAITWTAAEKLTDCSLVAWDACNAHGSPVFIRLSEQAMQSCRAEIPPDILPHASLLAFSLARTIRPADVEYYQFAANSSDERTPQAVCVCRSSGTLFSAGDQPKSWESLVFQAILRRHFGLDNFRSWLVESFTTLRANNGLVLGPILELRRSLDDNFPVGKCRGRDRAWVEMLQAALLTNTQDASKDVILNSFRKNHPELLHELLGMGVPAGQAFPSKSIPILVSAIRHPVYPVEYITDLQLVSMEYEHPSSENASSFPSKKEFKELQQKAATRILQFHSQHELLSPYLFLPINRQTWTIEKSHLGHRHAFQLPIANTNSDDAATFQEMLGLLDYVLDCDATHEDHLFQIPRTLAVTSPTTPLSGAPGRGPKQYSLVWLSDENRWRVDCSTAKNFFCCYSKPMLASEWTYSLDLRKLLNLDLRKLLKRWARGCSQPSCGEFAFLEPLTQKFTSRFLPDGLMLLPGSLRSAAKPVQVRQEMPADPVGDSDSLHVYEICWNLAWIERYTTRFGGQNFFDSRSLNSREFQIALARSLRMWPELMRRCLALAELLIWTLHLGGIGISAKFKTQFPSRKDPLATEPAERKNAKSDDTPPGTIRRDVDGLVIDWDNGVATVLLPAANCSLEDARRDDSIALRAIFEYPALEDVDKKYLEAEKVRRKKNPKDVTIPLSTLMIGQIVQCDLKKSDVWEIDKVRIRGSAAMASDSKYSQRTKNKN
jgi:hypothetical protein